MPSEGPPRVVFDNKVLLGAAIAWLHPEQGRGKHRDRLKAVQHAAGAASICFTESSLDDLLTRFAENTRLKPEYTKAYAGFLDSCLSPYTELLTPDSEQPVFSCAETLEAPTRLSLKAAMELNADYFVTNVRREQLGNAYGQTHAVFPHSFLLCRLDPVRVFRHPVAPSAAFYPRVRRAWTEGPPDKVIRRGFTRHGPG